MIINKSKYKNVFALELKTKYNSILVLPSEGGKIASFKSLTTGKEYMLQNPSPKFLHIGLKDSYVDGECCGFDDMFPTIDPVIIKRGEREVEYPDHGEVCRYPHQYDIIGQNLVLTYNSTSLGYEFKKIYSESVDGELQVRYEITNLSDFDLDAMWTAHCLVNAQKGGRVELDALDGEPLDVMFDYSNQLKAGERVAFTKDSFVTDWDKKRIVKKFYFPYSTAGQRLSYRYLNGDRFCMEFDREVSCIGVWMNFGYFNDSYCVGLEPSTVGYDTVINAERYGKKRVIKPKQTQSFSIKLIAK